MCNDRYYFCTGDIVEMCDHHGNRLSGPHKVTNIWRSSIGHEFDLLYLDGKGCPHGHWADQAILISRPKSVGRRDNCRLQDGVVKMPKLIECPLCGGESTYHFAKGFGHIAGCARCRVWTPWSDNKKDVIRTWNSRAEPEPRALMVEELREMDGQPVWIKSQKYEGWALVNLSRHEIGFLVDPNGETYGIGGADSLFDAYDRQPKGVVT